MELRNDKLVFNPCFPMAWPSVSITYKYGRSTYHITVFQRDTKRDMGGQNEQITSNIVQLVDDGLEHIVEVHSF
jgi:cellobiose phosphorylase